MSEPQIPAGMSEADGHRVRAAFTFIGRTGAETCGLRYQDDETPTVWLAVAGYSGGRFEVDAALHPLRALLRLCERLTDGGTCAHCGRPTGLEPDSLETMPMGDLVCWYQYDPELRKFRRGCE